MGLKSEAWMLLLPVIWRGDVIASCVRVYVLCVCVMCVCVCVCCVSVIYILVCGNAYTHVSG